MYVLPEALNWYVAQHSRPKDALYHYTGREALENIVRTRCMWATDLRAMNDPKELVFSRELIHRRLKKAAKESRNELRELFLSEVWKQFRRHFANASSSFSISLSEEANMPSQWRNYAMNGSGFALGWSVDSPMKPMPLKTWVTYDRGEQKRLIDGLIELHVSWISRSAREREKTPSEILGEAGLSLGIFLDIMLQTFKTPKWSAEREFRYVYQFFEGYIPVNQVFRSRFAGGVEKRYIEADFSIVALHCVVVGPANEGGETDRWLRRLLDENGFRDTAIIRSTVSLDDPAL